MNIRNKGIVAIVTAVLMLTPLFSWASSYSCTSAVQSLNSLFRQWLQLEQSETNNYYGTSPRIQIGEYLSSRPSFRIDTDQMHQLARKFQIPVASNYDPKIFDDILVEAIANNTLISLSDIKFLDEAERDPRYKSLETVSAKFKVSGISTTIENCAIVFSDKGKILKITPYTETINATTGKRSIKYNLEDLNDNISDSRSYGGTYNYSAHYPIGVSLFMSQSYVSVSLDCGFNLSNHAIAPYTVNKSEITNLMNYQVSKGLLYPKAYATITPGVFLKYCSIGFGVGMVLLEGDVIEYKSQSSITPEGVFSYTRQESTITGVSIRKFLMRPNIRGYIPCSQSFNIAISAGYLWVPAYKKSNCFEFGIGFNLYY